jgi:NAD(P)-dependent dehydrogenase (short-subunit alcohol dehydrogenase family)
MPILDLASFGSIRRFAEAYKARHARLDVLVNSAGIFNRERHTTEDGLEAQFQVNYLGPFLLTMLLMDPLKAAAPSRIVNVSSEAHRGASIDFGDLQGERGYRGWHAYGQSKLAQILFTRELARRLQGTGVTVNALHPGVIRTNLGKGEFPRAFDAVRFLFKGPTRGARTSLYVATAPALDGVTGKYFKGGREAKSSPASMDDAAARRVWDASVDLAGLTATSSGEATG